MTLATDIANNSLIITAPAQLADEVERFALDLDRQAERLSEEAAEVVRVVSVKNAPYVTTALKQLFGESVNDLRSPENSQAESASTARSPLTPSRPTNSKAAAGAPRPRP
jgi:hypothetical protein